MREADLKPFYEQITCTPHREAFEPRPLSSARSRIVIDSSSGVANRFCSTFPSGLLVHTAPALSILQPAPRRGVKESCRFSLRLTRAALALLPQ
jgi:hypothetical protein